MINTIDEVKTFLRIEADYTDEDTLLQVLITASEDYLYNATGILFNGTNALAKLFCMVLVTDWYENRELVGSTSARTRNVVESILAQLMYCSGGDTV